MIQYLLITLLTVSNPETEIQMLPEVIVYSNHQDIRLLAKLITAEANLESDYGKELIVVSVLQRVQHKKSSVKKQIFRSNIDKKGRIQYQYDGITTKYFRRDPSVHHINLARKVYNNIDKYPAVYYYVNEKIATDSKFIKRLYKLDLFLFEEGNHTFFKKE